MNVLANKNNSARANFGKDARRSHRVDFRGVGRVAGVGIVARGLSASEKVGSIEIKEKVRTGSGSDRAQNSQRGDRDEASYVLDTALKVLKVLECLEGRAFEPVTIERVMQRSGFNRSFVRTALITLKRAGWAKELIEGHERKFIHGHKAASLAQHYAAKLVSDPR